MKKYQLYETLNSINQILQSQNQGIEAGIIYALIKNQKIIEEEISIIEKMFNVQNIQNYNLFKEMKQEIIQKYKEQNFEQLNNTQMTKQQNDMHLYKLNILINNLKRQQSLQTFFNKFEQLERKRESFLNEQYDISNLKTIKEQQITGLKLTPQQMSGIFDLIK